MSLFKGWGELPPEYNKIVHGPYDPAVYYGKADTPFSQVKLGELGEWLSRRNKSPRAMAQAISRAWWRYLHSWILPRKPGPAGFYQMIFGIGLTGYLFNYSKIKQHRAFRYH